MNERMIQLGGPLYPVAPAASPTARANTAPSDPQAFRQALDRALQGAPAQELKFSAHAQQRLAQRNINLNEGDLERLTGAVNRAAQKGSRDSLILLGDVGMIVNVPNRTVVTAMESQEMKENIFTNIDSTVILER